MRKSIIAGSEIPATTDRESGRERRLAALLRRTAWRMVCCLFWLLNHRAGRLVSLCIACACSGIAHAWVALDVGHNLDQPGATSARGRTEFEFNRVMALELARSLRVLGVEARLINADGSIRSLTARARAARGAQLLVAIHHDSVQPQFLTPWFHDGMERLRSGDRFSGFSLFVSRRSAALGAGLRCASAIGEGLQVDGFRPSLYHAESVPGEFKPFADRTNGVHYFDNLVVLKVAEMPALLLEAGVIVNRDEEERLLDPARMRRMADAIARSIRACLATGRIGHARTAPF